MIATPASSGTITAVLPQPVVSVRTIAQGHAHKVSNLPDPRARQVKRQAKWLFINRVDAEARRPGV